jgi:hypothetical protein
LDLRRAKNYFSNKGFLTTVMEDVESLKDLKERIRDIANNHIPKTE